MKKYIWILFVLGLLSMPWSGQAQSWQNLFQQQIQDWTKELSANDPRFVPFVTATYQHQALASDSKQWLVTFRAHQDEIGYMVVGQAEDEFYLLEYGLGEYTLFDEEPVIPLQSDSSSRTPHYAGLQSVWVAKEGLFDAKSGEKYPKDTQLSTTPITSFVHQGDTLTAVKHRGNTDTQDLLWLKPGESIQSLEEVVDHLENRGDLSFIGHLFEGHILAPFSVLGVHKWGSASFIELEDDGSRFVPFEHAKDLGAFYR